MCITKQLQVATTSPQGQGPFSMIRIIHLISTTLPFPSRKEDQIGINQHPHGDTPPIATPSPKIQGLKIPVLPIWISWNPNSQALNLKKHVALEKARKNLYPKLFSEMLRKNPLRLPTI